MGKKYRFVIIAIIAASFVFMYLLSLAISHNTQPDCQICGITSHENHSGQCVSCDIYK